MKNNFIILTSLALTLTPVVEADTHVWSGAQNGLWSNPANWSSGGAPSAFEAPPVVIQFPSTSGPRRETTNDLINIRANVLAFFGTDYTLYPFKHPSPPVLTLVGGPPPFPYAQNLVCGGFNKIIATLVLADDISIGVGTNDYLAILGQISGAGGFTKYNPGFLALESGVENDYRGLTTILDGTVILKALEIGPAGPQPRVAIPGPLVIGGTNLNRVPVVQAHFGGQFGSNAPVTQYQSGVLDLSITPGQPQTIGSLAGAGLLKLGSNVLTLGGNNTNSFYFGEITGSGTVIKKGTGEWRFGGASGAFTGALIAHAGTFDIPGWFPLSTVGVMAGATMTGNGTVGHVTSAGGTFSPGCCPTLMRFTSMNVGLDSASTFRVQLDGTNGVAWARSSQVVVHGTVTLGNATLLGTLGFESTISNQFTIIDNDGNDPVAGTFKGFPEGTNFVLGAAQFRISYAGGDGNDVVLTHVADVPPPHLGGLTHVGNGQAQITGSGFAGLPYKVEASTNLMQWTSIGTAKAASPGGELTFTDTDAPNFKYRFYRFLLP
jgi:hypothetical protein